MNGTDILSMRGTSWRPHPIGRRCELVPRHTLRTYVHASSVRYDTAREAVEGGTGLGGGVCCWCVEEEVCVARGLGQVDNLWRSTGHVLFAFFTSSVCFLSILFSAEGLTGGGQYITPLSAQNLCGSYKVATKVLREPGVLES